MGDPEERSTAVDRAYRDHAADLYRLAFGILRDQDAATDATQVAFARAYERWDQYDQGRPVLPWLHGIVAHEALDSLRRRRVRWIAAATIAERESAGPRAADFDLATQVAQRSALDAALAQLKPIARAAVLLRHLYGYDYAEIGALLGTSQGNVGALLSRAHATLRQLLSEAELTADLPGTRTTRNDDVSRNRGEPNERQQLVNWTNQTNGRYASHRREPRRADPRPGLELADAAGGPGVVVGPETTPNWPAFSRRRSVVRTLVAAATLAAVLAVGAAAFAVWLALPPAKGPTNGAAGPSSVSPRPTVNPALLYSPPPTTTPAPLLPAYAAKGAPVRAEEVIVNAGSGPALLNLATGALTEVGAGMADSFNQLFALPDGSFVCVCTQTVRGAGQVPGSTESSVSVELQWFSASGTPGRTVVLPSYVGRGDPGITGEPEHAAVNANLGPGGASLDIAWTAEAPPVWRSGIDVIDLASGRVVQTLALPSVSDRVGAISAGVGPASVTFSSDGHLAMIERFGWSGQADLRPPPGTRRRRLRPAAWARPCRSRLARPASMGTRRARHRTPRPASLRRRAPTRFVSETEARSCAGWISAGIPWAIHGTQRARGRPLPRDRC